MTYQSLYAVWKSLIVASIRLIIIRSSTGIDLRFQVQQMAIQYQLSQLTFCSISVR